MSTPTYSELLLAPTGQRAVGHTVYWHRSPVQGQNEPDTWAVNFVVGDSLVDIVKDINPGQPEMPDWIYNGAILGVQGGTEQMLDYVAQVR